MFNECSFISCGVTEIGEFGDKTRGFVTKESIQQQISNSVAYHRRIVLASINEFQRIPVEPMLLELGFKRIFDWGINPNSGREIALYALDLYENREANNPNKDPD